ncbi:hypothetical protein Ancab_019225 [Ancistrocladus abbreviatus]
MIVTNSAVSPSSATFNSTTITIATAHNHPPLNTQILKFQSSVGSQIFASALAQSNKSLNKRKTKWNSVYIKKKTDRERERNIIDLFEGEGRRIQTQLHQPTKPKPPLLPPCLVPQHQQIHNPNSILENKEFTGRDSEKGSRIENKTKRVRETQ